MKKQRHYCRRDKGSSKIKSLCPLVSYFFALFFPSCLSTSLFTCTLSTASCFAEEKGKKRMGITYIKPPLVLARHFLHMTNAYRGLLGCQVLGQKLYLDYLNNAHNRTKI